MQHLSKARCSVHLGDEARKAVAFAHINSSDRHGPSAHLGKGLGAWLKAESHRNPRPLRGLLMVDAEILR